MQDVKEKINKVINDIPEEALEDVLEYLKSIAEKANKDIRLSQDLSKILKEDKILLERLAK